MSVTSLPPHTLPVLDKGYVRLVSHMGDDLTVVNAARVSFAKESKLTSDGLLKDADKKLIEFLVRNGHMSPFRHVMFQFEIKAPLMVLNQWHRYTIGSNFSAMDAWNEVSRRYVTMEPEFYMPSKWRSAPDNKKQGSGDKDLPIQTEADLDQTLFDTCEQAVKIYNSAIESGVAPEMARLFLPAYGLYSIVYWTASLQSVAHFLKERLDSHAQWEIQQYAIIVKDLIRPIVPVSLESLLTLRD